MTIFDIILTIGIIWIICIYFAIKDQRKRMKKYSWVSFSWFDIIMTSIYYILFIIFIVIIICLTIYILSTINWHGVFYNKVIFNS